MIVHRRFLVVLFLFVLGTSFALTRVGSKEPSQPERRSTASPTPAAGENSPGRELSPVEQVLLDSAGGQYEAYAELLLTFSDDGRLPIFHEQLDLGDHDPARALENYKKLTALTDRLIQQRDRARQVTEQFSRRRNRPGSLDDLWSRSFFQGHPAASMSLLAVEPLLEPAYKFWAWAENSRRRARANVLGIAYADPEKNRINPGEQKMVRQRIYQVAKQEFGNDPNIGGTELEFYQNLRDGKLDHLTQRLHTEMCQDASDGGLTYMTVAATQGKRTIDVVYEEGCRGLQNGVDLYVAAGKAAVSGGLGPSAGKHFEKGWDKAKEAYDKIESTEKEYKKFKEDPTGYVQGKVVDKLKEKVEEVATNKGKELLEHGREKIEGFREGEKFLRKANDAKNEVEAAAEDPSGFLLGKLDERLKIGDRVKKFAKDKTNLSDETIGFLGDRVSENITEMGRNLVFGEMVDKAVKAAGGDPDKVDMKEPLRRIRDADWDYGAVAVGTDSPSTEGEESEKSDPADEPASGAIAVWKDPESGDVKTTLQPIETDGAEVIPLPDDAQVDVLAVDDQGQLDPITEDTLTIDADRVVSVDRSDGTTQTASYDDYFEEDASEKIAETSGVDGPSEFGVTYGGIKVDLSQLYPPTDDSGNGLEVDDDAEDDMDDTWSDDLWGDEFEDDSGLTDDPVDTIDDDDADDLGGTWSDDLWGEEFGDDSGTMDDLVDTIDDDGDDDLDGWSIEDEDGWGSDNNGRDVDNNDNSTEDLTQTPEGTPKKKLPNIKPTSRRFLPEKCKIQLRMELGENVDAPPVVITIDGNTISGDWTHHVKSFTRPGCDFYGYNVYGKHAGTIEGNVITLTVRRWQDPNRSRHYSTNSNADSEHYFDYINTIMTVDEPIRGKTLLSEDGKWVTHFESYSYKWTMKNEGKLYRYQKAYMEETITTKPWSVGGTWSYVP